jgi:hypothetical protein
VAGVVAVPKVAAAAPASAPGTQAVAAPVASAVAAPVAGETEVKEVFKPSDVEAVTSPGMLGKVETSAPRPAETLSAEPSNRWMWVVGVQGLLIVVLLFRRKPAPPVEEPKDLPVAPSPISGDPVKVLIVAEMEGRHFLLGATDSNTGMIREATAQWADQRTATEVLLTPIGGARSNRNTSTGSSESAEARLAAKVYGKSVR